MTPSKLGGAALDKRGIGILALGHLLNDVNQGAVSALLPFLVAQRGLSYTSAAGVVLAATLISAILQPLLGVMSDRRPLPWLIPLGMFLGGLGIGLAGLLPDYAFIITAVIISGAGVAAFHPESYRFANYVSRQQRGRGMSIFNVGGNLGFAVGPALITTAVLGLGLAGTWVMAVPATLYALLLWRELPRFNQFRPTTRGGKAADADAVTDWSAFVRLTIVIVLRTALYYGLLAFVPAYLISVRGLTIVEANSHLTMISMAGAVGTLLAGTLSDRLGRKRILLMALGALPLLLLGFLNTSGWVASIALMLAGMATAAAFTVGVVMGQEYAAANLGVASGVTTGAAIGLGGLASPLLGRIADVSGLTTVLLILTALPLLAFAIAITLPKIHRR